MSLSESVVDLVEDASQTAIRPVAKPERDRSEAMAQHAREGEETDRAAVELYPGLGKARFSPEA
jgi:hypothetical protein